MEANICDCSSDLRIVIRLTGEGCETLTPETMNELTLVTKKACMAALHDFLMCYDKQTDRDK